jgi:hypothetical protein
VSTAALKAFRDTRSLYLVSLLLRRGTLAPSDRRLIEEGVVESARLMRRQASEGQYSIGIIRVGALLGRLALVGRRSAMFEEATSFALDPRVPLEERIAAVGPFLAEPTKVPARFGRRLASGLPAAEIGFPLFGTPTELKGINLRISSTFGDPTPSVALGELLELAHSPSQEARLQAVRSLPVLRGGLDSSTLVAVLVGLTHDPDPFVRAAAGNALAATDMPEVFQEMRVGRLVELLEEAGELVPRAVWLGLTERRRSGGASDPEMAARAGRVARGHIAHTVRQAAAGFLLAEGPAASS